MKRDQERDRPRKLWWILIAAAVGLCGLGGLLVTRLWLDLPQSAGLLDREWRRAEQNGLPLVASDLSDEGPHGANAAEPLAAAMAELESIPRSREAEVNARRAIAAGNWELAKKELVAFEPVFAKLEAVAAADGHWPNWDYDQSAYLQLPEFAGFRQLAKLAALRAQVRARSGNVEGAMSDLRAIRTFARFAGQHPILIGKLVQVALYTIHDRTVEQIADLWRDDSGRLNRLANHQGVRMPMPYLRDALRGEVYMSVAFMRNFNGNLLPWTLSDPDSSLPPPVPPDRLRRSGKPQSFLGRAFLGRILAFWNDWFEANEGVDDPLEISRSLARAVARIEDRNEVSYAMLKVLLPVFDQAGPAMVKAQASQKTTLALVRALGHRARTGRYPRSLAELPGDWSDPFGTGPLRIRADGSALVIWSVGPDGADDGGIWKTNSRSPTKDICAVFPKRT